jgi:hypothetical protein
MDLSIIENPTAIPLLGILAFSAMMFPVGLLLPSCGCCSSSCSLSDSVGSPTLTSIEYACDNANPTSSHSYGSDTAGYCASGIERYFSSGRTKTISGQSVSFARQNSCENVCNSTSLVPAYFFSGTPPSVTITLTFSGSTALYVPYQTKFSSSDTTFEDHCFYYTTISQFSGSYSLTHAGGGVYYYCGSAGADRLEIVASLHRCNSVAMWLVTVSFVSRSTKSRCNTTTCNSSSMSSGSKILRCCLGHVVQYAIQCVRTSATFSSEVSCTGSISSSIPIDVIDASLLSTSGTLSISRDVTTSGNDNEYGNSYATPGVVQRGIYFNRANSSYNAPCYCVYDVNTFRSQVFSNLPTSASFSLSVT